MKMLKIIICCLAFLAVSATAGAQSTIRNPQSAIESPTYEVGLSQEGTPVVIEKMTNVVATSSAAINEQIAKLDEEMAKLSDQRRLLASLLPAVLKAEADAAAKAAETQPPTKEKE